jgi:hypothetical protein
MIRGLPTFMLPETCLGGVLIFYSKYHISIIAVHQMKWSSVASGQGNSLEFHYIFYVRIRWMAKSLVHVPCIYFDPPHVSRQL